MILAAAQETVKITCYSEWQINWVCILIGILLTWGVFELTDGMNERRGRHHRARRGSTQGGESPVEMIERIGSE